MCLGQSTPQCHVQQYHLKCTYFTHNQFWSRKINVYWYIHTYMYVPTTCTYVCAVYPYMQYASVIHGLCMCWFLYMLAMYVVCCMLFYQFNGAESQSRAPAVPLPGARDQLSPRPCLSITVHAQNSRLFVCFCTECHITYVLFFLLRMHACAHTHTALQLSTGLAAESP